MPMYEYQCNACSGTFETIRKFSDPPLTECRLCGAEGVRKLLSAPAFRLKGGGWYETDFKSGNQRNVVKGDSDGGGKSDSAGASRSDGGDSGKSDSGKSGAESAGSSASGSDAASKKSEKKSEQKSDSGSKTGSAASGKAAPAKPAST